MSSSSKFRARSLAHVLQGTAGREMLAEADLRERE